MKRYTIEAIQHYIRFVKLVVHAGNKSTARKIFRKRIKGCTDLKFIKVK